MSYLFSSKSVSVDYPDSGVACQTMVTTGQVIISVNVRSKTYLDIQNIIRKP